MTRSTLGGSVKGNSTRILELIVCCANGDKGQRSSVIAEGVGLVDEKITFLLWTHMWLHTNVAIGSQGNLRS